MRFRDYIQARVTTSANLESERDDLAGIVDVGQCAGQVFLVGLFTDQRGDRRGYGDRQGRIVLEQAIRRLALLCSDGGGKK